MSRIGKKTVQVPAGVKVAVKGDDVSITGPKGTLNVKIKHDVKVAYNEADKTVICTTSDTIADERQTRAQWGTTRALIQNAIIGVTTGYEKALEVVGVGWTAALNGNKLKLVAGLANPLIVEVPKGLTVTVDKQIVKVSGADKQAVGEWAASTRALRKPEPYNGKGIKYTTETIRRKQGKQFGA